MGLAASSWAASSRGQPEAGGRGAEALGDDAPRGRAKRRGAGGQPEVGGKGAGRAAGSRAASSRGQAEAGGRGAEARGDEAAQARAPRGGPRGGDARWPASPRAASSSGQPEAGGEGAEKPPRGNRRGCRRRGRRGGRGSAGGTGPPQDSAGQQQGNPTGDALPEPVAEASVEGGEPEPSEGPDVDADGPAGEAAADHTWVPGQPSSSAPLLSEEEARLLAEDKERCIEILQRLEGPSCQATVEWLLEATLPLAMSRDGSRVVQKALEVAQSNNKTALLEKLAPFTRELIISPHGNFVVTKVVEVMPSEKLGPFIDEVQGFGAINMARHRFGCRLLERLVEHCSDWMLWDVLNAIVQSADTLCRHPYGNFVVQTILEHGSADRKKAVLDKLLGADLSRLAMHRTASHVVQKVLEYTDKDGQEKIVRLLVKGPPPTPEPASMAEDESKVELPKPLVEVACSRYGSFVLETIASIRPGVTEDSKDLREVLLEVRNLLLEGLSELGGSPYGQRVAARFGLEVPGELGAVDEMPPTDSEEVGVCPSSPSAWEAPAGFL